VTAGRRASRTALDQAIREYLAGPAIHRHIDSGGRGDEPIPLGHVLTGVLRLLSGEIERGQPGPGSNTAGEQGGETG